MHRPGPRCGPDTSRRAGSPAASARTKPVTARKRLRRRSPASPACWRRRRRLVRPLLVDGRPLPGLDRRRLCRRQERDARRQGRRLCRRRCGRRQRAGRAPATSSPASTTATTASRSRPRATRSRPSRRPSSASASRSRRSRPPSSRPRRSSPPRKAGATRAELELEAPAGRSPRADYASQPDARAGAGQPRPGRRRRAGRAGRDRSRRQANVDVLKAQQEEAARTLERIQDRARQGRARSVVHRDPRAVRRRGRQPRHAGRRLRAARRSGSRAWCRSTPSMSTPTSRRRSSRELQPGQPVSIAVDALPGRTHRGHGRERRAGLRLGVLAAAARQRDRQLHQDRAAPAGAHPVPAEVAEQGLLRPGMSVVVERRHQAGAPRHRAREHGRAAHER